MPLARYFLLVGGALLVVLLVAGAWLPLLPVVEQAETQRPKIRILTEMKLPERVVFDTSMPAVTHPLGLVRAETGAPSVPSADDVSAKARQAFAHLQSSDVSKSKLADTKRPELNLRHRGRAKQGSARQHRARSGLLRGILSSIGLAAGCGGETATRVTLAPSPKLRHRLLWMGKPRIGKHHLE